ncbi:heat shock protein 70 family, partial [Blyttiomyces helicus]
MSSIISKAIGIDLATQNSRVAVWVNNKVEAIPDELGNYTTPSFVAFTDTGRLVGEAAKRQRFENPTNTVYDVKRLIGRRFDDAEMQRNLPRWPFTVSNDMGRPIIQVEFKGEKRQFCPEEILAMLLAKFKDNSEAFLGHDVTEAVFTVPAYFNFSQRQAIKDAATIAGLNVLRFIAEPTAAACALVFGDIKNILVLSLGASDCNVSLLGREAGEYNVKATAG